MSGDDQLEDEIRDELRRLRAPDEGAAVKRAVLLAATVAGETSRGRVAAPRRRRTAAAIAALGAVVGGLLVLTPAGAEVRDWVGDVVDTEVPDARPSLTRLPAEGKLLVSGSASGGGTWIVDEDGSRRRLGPYTDAAWSPTGAYAAVARGRGLSAVDPTGEIRWSISGPGRIADPAWAPGCCRIAYRSGSELWVVAGDGDPRLRLDGGVAAVAPSWKPAPYSLDDTSPNTLAWADRGGRVTAADADSGEILWRTPRGEAVVSVTWMSDRRVLVARRDSVEVLSPRGDPIRSVDLPRGADVAAVTASPDAEVGAVVTTTGTSASAADSRSALLLARLGPSASPPREVFSGPGTFEPAVFSPDGAWLLLGWREADQWLFIRPTRVAEVKLLQSVEAIGAVSRQFDPGGTGPAPFPEVAGWCCE